MLLFRKFYFTILIANTLTFLRLVLNLDRGHCFPATKYDGGGLFQVSGVLPCVSKHKMLLNLIGKESADCLMVNSPQCGQRGRGTVAGIHEDKTETVKLWRIDSVLALLTSTQTDILIIILSETKVTGVLKTQTGSRLEGIVILTPDVVRGRWHKHDFDAH